MNRYIAGVAEVSELKEDKISRKIIYGDLDKDGDEDVTTLSILGFETGGNFYVQSLAVFSNTDGKFSAVTDIDVGSFTKGYAELKSVKNGKIYIEVNGKNKSYILKDNKLVEFK